MNQRFPKDMRHATEVHESPAAGASRAKTNLHRDVAIQGWTRPPLLRKEGQKSTAKIIGKRDQTEAGEVPDSLVRPDPDRGKNASRASPGAHHVSGQRMGNPPFS